MIVNEPTKVSNNKEQKRRGFLYQPHGTLTGIKDTIKLKQNFIFRNRISVQTDSQNVIEMYVTEQAKGVNENYLYIGRKGDDKETMNINYLEMVSNCDTSKDSLNSDGALANGVIQIGVAVDKVLASGQLVIFEGRSSGLAPGSIIASLSGGGSEGQVQIVFGSRAIFIDKDGIGIQGLPTSDPGVAGYLWNSAGTLKISL